MSDRLNDLTNTLAEVDTQLDRLSASRELMATMLPDSVADIDSLAAEGRQIRDRIVSAIELEKALIRLEEITANFNK